MTTPVSTNLQKNVTLEEYFELELASDETLEYWNGNVWSMSGASLAHNFIVRNAGTEFDIQLRQHDCQVLPSDMRVKVPAYPPYRYLTALCGPVQIEKIGGLDVLVNPSLIVEVLSPSSEALGRGDKFSYYQSIPTFQEYLLVAQHRPYVSHYWKQEGGFWLLSDSTNLSDVISCKSVPCELTLAAIYRGVDFERDAEKPIVRPQPF